MAFDRTYLHLLVVFAAFVLVNTAAAVRAQGGDTIFDRYDNDADSVPAKTFSQELPVFNSKIHTYLAPVLARDVDRPVKLGNLESELQTLGKEHGLQYYFMMTQRVGDLSKEGDNYAVEVIDDVRKRLGKEFPDRTVLIMLVRSDLNKDKFAYGVYGGDVLASYGMNGAFFNNPSGLLVLCSKAHLPADPEGFAIAVAEGINSNISRAESQKKSARH